jgi:uncharacterized protein (TIGR01777 family)
MIPVSSGQRIAITGATGLLGSALSAAFTAAGHTVVPVSRRPLPGGILWNPVTGHLDPEPFEGLDAVIHLAGANIAGKRWSAARKQLLVESRVGPTQLISRALATLDQPPGVLISASAIGIYGNRGDEELTERSKIGDEFLGSLGAAWEAAADPARSAGIRVVHPRFGLVLTAAGGVLGRMLTPFRLGIAGRLGDGRQWMSWIAIDDAIGACELALSNGGLEGPINVVAPTPVRNAEFTKTLARVLSRPAVIPVPGRALRTIFGEMADHLLLSSQRVAPAALVTAGHRFRHPTLEPALGRLLHR